MGRPWPTGLDHPQLLRGGRENEGLALVTATPSPLACACMATPNAEAPFCPRGSNDLGLAALDLGGFGSARQPELPHPVSADEAFPGLATHAATVLRLLLAAYLWQTGRGSSAGSATLPLHPRRSTVDARDRRAYTRTIRSSSSTPPQSQTRSWWCPRPHRSRCGNVELATPRPPPSTSSRSASVPGGDHRRNDRAVKLLRAPSPGLSGRPGRPSTGSPGRTPGRNWHPRPGHQLRPATLAHPGLLRACQARSRATAKSRTGPRGRRCSARRPGRHGANCVRPVLGESRFV